MVWSVATYFSDLAAAVSRHQGQIGDVRGGLTAAAAAALQEVPPGPYVGAVPLLEHVARTGDISVKQSSLSDPFGQPPLVMWTGQDFFIQALTWLDGTTDVHQHGFDGAFAVAEGASLHVPYTFELAETVADGHLVAGELTMRNPEVLRPGDVRTIDAGFCFVHALFHLERPTVTIVVRNSSSGLPHPQYSYLRPGLGFDKLWSDRLVGRRLQALGALGRLDPPGAEGTARELMAQAPVWVAFLALRDIVARSGWSELAADLSEILARRLGGAGELLAPAFQQECQQGNVMARRALLTERRHRTLLALLANLPDQLSVRGALGSLYPGRQPERLLLDWVAELASVPYRTISGLRLTDAQQVALRSRLEGDGPNVELDLSEALRELLAGWQASPLLQPLLVT